MNQNISKGYTSLTPDQIWFAQSSFTHVMPYADTVATLFYHRLFTLDPSLRPLFQGDLANQGHKLIPILRLVVHGLSRLDTLVPIVELLGERSGRYGVRDEQYATVGSALLWAIDQVLGTRLTAEGRAAWASAYTLLANTMQAAGLAPSLVEP